MECASLEGEARRDFSFPETVGGVIGIWARSVREKRKPGPMVGCLGDGAGGREETGLI